jgi:hypothetical protein
VRTQRFYWKRAARGTSARFLEFLHQLHQRFPETLLILILDNATIHKSRAVKRFLIWFSFCSYPLVVCRAVWTACTKYAKPVNDLSAACE